MTTASDRVQPLNRRQNGRPVIGRAGLSSRSQPAVSRDDAYTFALRVAYLHYLLQPRTKRRQYAPAPAPKAAPPATGIGHLLNEVVPSGSGTLKLPYNFRVLLERRMQGVLHGSEKLPGFNDAAVKRSFAEAYTAFTDKNFQKSVDRERTGENLILIFYSSAVKVAQKGCTDDSWKLLPDRHVALFVKLMAAILSYQSDKDLHSRLHSLEQKLLTSDQDLGEEPGVVSEVIVPLSFAIKDMAMVQHVARIFGVSPPQAQDDINAHRSLWTDEAALQDSKSYLNRLNVNSAGTLSVQDFEVQSAFEDWKRVEVQHLTRIIQEMIAANSDLAKPSSISDRKLSLAGPASGVARPIHSEDQAHSDRTGQGRHSNGPSPLYSTPLHSTEHSFNLSNASLDQPSTIRSVDDPSYTFIPQDPRAFYKAILQYAIMHDEIRAHSSETDYIPLSTDSTELLVELSIRWRIPQSSRLVVFVEVVAGKFLDRDIDGEELDTTFEIAKTPAPAAKKPYIQNFHATLSTINRTCWSIRDSVSFQQTLGKLYDALQRDLYTILMQCYGSKNPSAGVVMHNIENHIRNDPAFIESASSAAEFTSTLSNGLRKQAELAYRELMDESLPPSPEEWNFVHVVSLGKAIIKLCDRIRKRYQTNPVIMGVNPHTELVEIVFPSFESDISTIVQSVIKTASDNGIEVHLDDGFSLYKELVAIRRIHERHLPNDPFVFDIEELLIEFVWRYLSDADSKQLERIEEAIKLDPFNVRQEDPDVVADDSARHSSSVIDVFMLFNATVNEVSKLHWENELHHAKFMTAVSKTFAAGLGRYCKLVEQQFLQEMDRPAAQEAATTSMTTQERFLQYAKDALTTKEKPEPFHFYPESFVKLNNVEYAIHQVDRLETTMNVNACAEIIERMEGITKPIRKPSNYVFTVKIVEAEDIRACDSSGTSDPYVILGDEFKKRLYKTKIIYRTLNPRWDESVDVTAQGPVNLVVTIWDFDTFGEHNCVGRTSLKLDPLQFSDYLPREFWLDLDTQGRILLRISMEGERDDIHFHFGKAFRYLKRTERDMVRKITEKLSPLINQTLSKETLRSLLKTGGIGASVASFWKKSPGPAPATGPTSTEIDGALLPLCRYFNENFAMMNQTLTKATMNAVMARLWKEVLLAFERLLLPPLSEKPSTQKSLSQTELEITFTWVNQLFEFFNAKDQSGVQLGVPIDLLKSPEWLELVSVNFFYLDETAVLIRESERIAVAEAQRTQQTLMRSKPSTAHRLSAPVTHLSPNGGSGSFNAPFASLGTIRRGKSLMMSRNLGMMRRVKEEKRREAQAEPNDDMILRILRMRPEAAGYLKERLRQKERQAATAAAAMIVKNSVYQGWSSRTMPGAAAARSPQGRTRPMS